ncbi:MAG: sorbosone dehydrogenase family protein [Terriglobales bacterium]
MTFRRLLWRGLILMATMAAVALVVFLLLNVRGWRALVLARLLRVDNDPVVVKPPANFQPTVPAGFKVSVFAAGFTGPRWLAVAPDGDVFVADSAAGEVLVLQDRQGKGSSESRYIFAGHLNLPFGIAFHDDYVYIADTNEVLRFRYDPKTSKPLGDAEHILDLPGMGYHQHWTRSLAFGPDGKKLFVSVGSKTNVSIESDQRRAAVLAAAPDGTGMRIYASGLRNAVGIAINPESGSLWAAVNERDDIDDNTPSDYFTHIVDGGFYGWPYAYAGPHVDDRVSSRPDLVAKTIVPDVLLGAHVAPLQVAFYDKQMFPSSYWRGAFVAEHGSWNRRLRSGYQVVFIPFLNGVPAGEPRSFFSGFVPDPTGKDVYGRMVGVAVAADGSLLISDDGANLIWRVSYEHEPPPALK